MKESIKTVFQCDFCDKRLFRRSAMTNHESKCTRNPINNDACIDCIYCQEKKVEYVIEGDYGDSVQTAKGFHCAKLEIDIYPHKVVTKGLLTKYPETFEGKQVMPNKCEHYRYFAF